VRRRFCKRIVRECLGWGPWIGNIADDQFQGTNPDKICGPYLPKKFESISEKLFTRSHRPHVLRNGPERRRRTRYRENARPGSKPSARRPALDLARRCLHYFPGQSRRVCAIPEFQRPRLVDNSTRCRGDAKGHWHAPANAPVSLDQEAPTPILLSALKNSVVVSRFWERRSEHGPQTHQVLCSAQKKKPSLASHLLLI